jgi:hypothetical protein
MKRKKIITPTKKSAKAKQKRNQNEILSQQTVINTQNNNPYKIQTRQTKITGFATSFAPVLPAAATTTAHGKESGISVYSLTDTTPQHSIKSSPLSKSNTKGKTKAIGQKKMKHH